MKYFTFLRHVGTSDEKKNQKTMCFNFCGVLFVVCLFVSFVGLFLVFL